MGNWIINHPQSARIVTSSLMALVIAPHLLTFVDCCSEYQAPPTDEPERYFTEIAYGSEYGYGGGNVLHRWEGQVRVQALGDYTDEDFQTLEEVIRELIILIPELSISLVETSPNIRVYFAPENRFGIYDRRYVPINMGWFRVWWDERGVITSGQVLIASEGISQSERNHLIREELTQSLGLLNDSWRYPDSIFYQGWTDTQEYSALDRAVIRRLYADADCGYI